MKFFDKIKYQDDDWPARFKGQFALQVVLTMLVIVSFFFVDIRFLLALFWGWNLAELIYCYSKLSTFAEK